MQAPGFGGARGLEKAKGGAYPVPGVASLHFNLNPDLTMQAHLVRLPPLLRQAGLDSPLRVMEHIYELEIIGFLLGMLLLTCS